MTDIIGNPLGMVPDPFGGDTFVLAKTDCTKERSQFFKRMNEIQAFLFVTRHSFDVCKERYDKNIIPQLPSGANTPIRLKMDGGSCVILPAFRVSEIATNGINILTRQAFVMFYGSFETYLFQLFERAFPLIGVTDNILDKSREILMLKKWAGKFCKMNEVFSIDYKSRDLIGNFKNFEMKFEGKSYDNPLTFMDEIAQVRHRIVHASSLLENDKLIVINMNIFLSFFGFFCLLTDYIDERYSKRFEFTRTTINPAEA